MKTEEVRRRIEQAGMTTGVSNTRESLRASSGIRALIKEAFPAATIHFITGHFYCSGFVERPAAKFVYFAFSDYRYFPNSAYCRTAKNERDFEGGRNVPCTVENLVDTIRKIFVYGG